MRNALSRTDLNLLVALKVLIEERNVTKAAERLFITQPAMSKTLHRLRRLFDDPLFTRTSHGLVPTPKTEELSAPLHAILAQIETSLLMPDFNPAKVRGKIFITAPEFFAIGAIPMLLDKLQQQAPHLLIQSRNLLDNQEEQLANGQLDFAIDLQQHYGTHITCHELFTTKAVLWMREQHPLASKARVTRKELIQYPFISLLIPNIHDMDLQTTRERLVNSGIGEQPILRTSQLLTALESLARSDCLLIGPDYLGRFKLTKSHIISKAIPKGLRVDNFPMRLCLIQHQRTHNSHLHIWLRELMLALFQD